MAPAASGVPTGSERGTKSQVAQKWARWLHNPCRLVVPRFRVRGRIRGRPQVGKAATIPLPLEGSHRFKVAHKSAKWGHNPCRLEGSHRFRTGDTI